MKLHHLLIVLFLFLVGCSPGVTILLDGQPIPNYAYTVRNPNTGLSMEVIAAQVIEKNVDGETVLWPVYSKVDKVYHIDPEKTKYIMVQIRVKNPNKVQYLLTQSCLNKKIFSGKKSDSVVTAIYQGHLMYRSFTINYRIKNNNFKKISFEVWDKDINRIMKVGSFSYKMLQEETNQQWKGVE